MNTVTLMSMESEVYDSENDEYGDIDVYGE